MTDGSPEKPGEAGPAATPELINAAPTSATTAGASTEAPLPIASSSAAALEQEGEIAADYLEGLLDIVDLDGDLDLDVERDRAIVAIVGAELNQLVGPNGATLEALQELTRLAVLQRTGTRSRLMLDIAGWRSGRRQELTNVGRAAAERAVSSGEAQSLAPMTPFERKVVHDAVAASGHARSESEGEEPQRRVVVHPI